MRTPAPLLLAALLAACGDPAVSVDVEITIDGARADCSDIVELRLVATRPGVEEQVFVHDCTADTLSASLPPGEHAIALHAVLRAAPPRTQTFVHELGFVAGEEDVILPAVRLALASAPVSWAIVRGRCIYDEHSVTQVVLAHPLGEIALPCTVGGADVLLPAGAYRLGARLHKSVRLIDAIITCLLFPDVCEEREEIAQSVDVDIPVDAPAGPIFFGL